MLTGSHINDDFNKTSPLKFEVNPLKILVSFFLDNVWNKRWKPPYYFWATQGCLAVLPANVHLLTDKDIVWPWEGVSLTLRMCEAVLASVVDPQRPLVVELEQLKGNLAIQPVPLWSCQPIVSRMKMMMVMMMMVPTKRDHLDFLPVHRDQGDWVLLVDRLDRGNAFHRVCSHDPLIAGKERVNLLFSCPVLHLR